MTACLFFFLLAREPLYGKLSAIYPLVPWALSSIGTLELQDDLFCE